MIVKLLKSDDFKPDLGTHFPPRVIWGTWPYSGLELTDYLPK